jgi:hypothetical protein
MTDRLRSNPTDAYALVWPGDTSRESISLATRRTVDTEFDLDRRRRIFLRALKSVRRPNRVSKEPRDVYL